MANKISKSKKEIAGLTREELAQKVGSLQEHFFQLKMQWRTGQLANFSAMMHARKELARTKTALRAKEIGKN